ncbi:hypothetical protein AAAC51_06430 [Priestia megaterium]
MTLNLTNLLAEQVTGYFTNNSSYDVNNLKKINYVTASNGLFRVEKPILLSLKYRFKNTKKYSRPESYGARY